MSNRTVPAAAEGLPVIAATIDPAALAALDMNDLKHLHAATSALANVTAAFCSQPRSQRRDGRIGCRSETGHVMDALNDLMCGLQDAALCEARRRQPINASDAEERAWILLRDATASEDYFCITAALAAELAAGLEKAR